MFQQTLKIYFADAISDKSLFFQSVGNKMLNIRSVFSSCRKEEKLLKNLVFYFVVPDSLIAEGNGSWRCTTTKFKC